VVNPLTECSRSTIAIDTQAITPSLLLAM